MDNNVKETIHSMEGGGVKNSFLIYSKIIRFFIINNNVEIHFYWLKLLIIIFIKTLYNSIGVRYY